MGDIESFDGLCVQKDHGAIGLQLNLVSARINATATEIKIEKPSYFSTGTVWILSEKFNSTAASDPFGSSLARIREPSHRSQIPPLGYKIKSIRLKDYNFKGKITSKIRERLEDKKVLNDIRTVLLGFSPLTSITRYRRFDSGNHRTSIPWAKGRPRWRRGWTGLHAQCQERDRGFMEHRSHS